jgi:hypothetical protein
MTQLLEKCKYRISREEVLSLIQNVYEEGVYGYLDLQDDICLKMVNEFLDGRTPLSDCDWESVEIIGSIVESDLQITEATNLPTFLDDSS